MTDALASPAALCVRDLRFRFGQRDVQAGGTFELTVGSFQVEAGTEVLLTGGSGSGKSTLLQLIAGLLDPSAGRVEIAGTDIHRLRGAARDHFRGRSIGMIFQTFHLALGFTARENVMLALLFGSPDPKAVPKGHAARAEELLTHLGIERLDAKVETLSVGQQQRVAVARALACHPPLVLADEPTASLDPPNAAKAIQLLRTTCREQGASLVCVSHDPSLIPLFDRHVDLPSIVHASPAGARR